MNKIKSTIICLEGKENSGKTTFLDNLNSMKKLYTEKNELEKTNDLLISFEDQSLIDYHSDRINLKQAIYLYKKYKSEASLRKFFESLNIVNEIVYNNYTKILSRNDDLIICDRSPLTSLITCWHLMNLDNEEDHRQENVNIIGDSNIKLIQMLAIPNKEIIILDCSLGEPFITQNFLLTFGSSFDRNPLVSFQKKPLREIELTKCDYPLALLKFISGLQSKNQELTRKLAKLV